MSPSHHPLDDADACHDDEPARAATLLADVDVAQLDAAQRPRMAFLLNHVLGEKLGRWRDAHARQQALLAAAGEQAAAVLWRQAGAAARLAGDAAAEAAAASALAASAGAPPGQAAQVVALAAASFRVPALPDAEAGAATIDALAALDRDPAWQRAGGLDAAAAACCNNLSAHLSERPLDQLGVAPLRAAMAASGEWSQRLWQRAGTWVHHERACYQRAIVANTLGEPHRAQAHAREGLALLDAHDASNEEFVDRAFLELELAHASERMGLAAEATAARERAQALTAKFGDAGLEDWFASREARLKLLARG
jgi:hypothetical protein